MHQQTSKVTKHLKAIQMAVLVM